MIFEGATSVHSFSCRGRVNGNFDAEVFGVLRSERHYNIFSLLFTPFLIPHPMATYADPAQNTSHTIEPSADDAGKKKKTMKRRKVNHACLYCRRSHMTCDDGRPCQRW